MSKQNNWNFSDWRFFPFATGVHDTSDAPWAGVFEKIRNRYSGALGETDSLKKTWTRKSRVTVPLNISLKKCSIIKFNLKSKI